MTTGHATRLCACVALAFLSCTISSSVALGQEVIPHAQDAPPNPPKSPTEAIKAMKVPEGFTVELVASEPDIVNPVAMTIDEKGRFWITESLEYPRREPGPGRDRVKVLEDTNGDGKADKFTIFFDGLNIPSGIAVGYGGVWVANAPDILFIPDANRDAVADGPPEVVVSGFGRDDTHELPNSLTWGPDGWLYGWNGVFNPAKVKSNSGKTYEFTCAIWRIHPISREFQIFCEGTSNPWGIAINDDGEFFASACVIDHLWHLAQGAYYIRQGGPYPPFTYPAKSIVDHKHQKAAYCGIHWFDSDAYPEQYRNKLYMGNIHGNCINVDEIERKGSTYKASDCPDFLSANDAWFMPVVQQTGPDGSLYILDWYDRYHCYQDANRDPEGIDRLKGRLYRVRYKETPRAKIDLANEPSARLFDLLGAPNVFIRATARRLLIERGLMKHAPDRDPKPDSFYACPDLTNAAFNQEVSRTRRLESLWTIFALNGLLGTLPNSHTYKRALTDSDPVVRAWGLRGVSMLPNEVAVTLGRDIQAEIVGVLRDEKHPVVLRTLLGLGISEPDTSRLGLLGLSCLLRNSESDDLLTHLAWRAESLAADSAENTGELARFLNNLTPQQRERIAALWPRIIDRLVGNPTADGETLALVLKAGLDQANDDVSYRRPMLDSLTRAIRQGRFSGERLKSLQESLQDSVRRRLSDGSDPLQVDFVELAGAWGDPEALDALRKRLADNTSHPAARFEALEILVSRQDEGVVVAVAKLLTDHDAPGELRDNIFGTLGPLENARLADVVIDAYPALSPQSRQRALVLLSERASWGRTLLAAVEKDRVSKQDLNLNHLRKLLATKDPEVVRLIQLRWGSIRAGRNEQRDLVVGQMRNFLKKTTGNPAEGKRVYTKVCAQCHKIYGEGEEVGPDITLNGRNDFDQLISNVFDPNLVIGQGYQAVTVAATDGRILSGLLVENSPTRVVLKLQGGRVATLAREEVEELKTSEISLMPEDVEKQLTPQEIADLFAFLALDKPPDDPKAKRLPGAP
jgi:putative heme-binding domain-containing protein